MIDFSNPLFARSITDIISEKSWGGEKYLFRSSACFHYMLGARSRLGCSTNTSTEFPALSFQKKRTISLACERSRNGNMRFAFVEPLSLLQYSLVLRTNLRCDRELRYAFIIGRHRTLFSFTHSTPSARHVSVDCRSLVDDNQ